jgi:hypothetical protein
MPPPRVYDRRLAERERLLREASGPIEARHLIAGWEREDELELVSRRLDDVERAQMDQRIRSLEAQVARLADLLEGDGADSIVEVLGKAFGERDRRLDALEQYALRYTGVWDEQRRYAKGCAVSHSGSLFVAVADCEPGERPNRAATWRLAIKGAEPHKPVIA